MAASVQIRKDYPTTGVLKLISFYGHVYANTNQIRKDYPTTGVLKLACNLSIFHLTTVDQEGLPDYWGIETFLVNTECSAAHRGRSGRITRLLGY